MLKESIELSLDGQQTWLEICEDELFNDFLKVGFVLGGLELSLFHFQTLQRSKSEFMMLCGSVLFCLEIEIRLLPDDYLFLIHFLPMTRNECPNCLYNQISFIKQVLSDPQKKAIYDQYGEEGLKDIPPPSSGSFPFGNGSGGGSSGFNPRNAEDIFAEFFGSSPFGFGSSGPGKSMRYQSEGGVFGGFGGSENLFRTYSENVAPKKPPPVESKLPCTLEELYSGSTRKMKISRTVVDANGYAIFFPFYLLASFFWFRLCDIPLPL